jgi:hypothetical protein
VINDKWRQGRIIAFRYSVLGTCNYSYLVPATQNKFSLYTIAKGSSMVYDGAYTSFLDDILEVLYFGSQKVQGVVFAAVFAVVGIMGRVDAWTAQLLLPTAATRKTWNFGLVWTKLD